MLSNNYEIFSMLCASSEGAFGQFWSKIEVHKLNELEFGGQVNTVQTYHFTDWNAEVPVFFQETFAAREIARSRMNHFVTENFQFYSGHGFFSWAWLSIKNKILGKFRKKNWTDCSQD